MPNRSVAQELSCWNTGVEGDRRPEEEYEYKRDQIYRLDSFCCTGEQDIADEQRIRFDER